MKTEKYAGLRPCVVGSGQPGPALHERSVQAAVKTVKTNCVCSGAHCAAVGGFAALRMRRPLYGERAPCMLAIFAARILRREAFKFVIARRPTADVAISQYPAGSWGSCRRKRNCLPEIAPQGHILALRAQGATSLRSSQRQTFGFYHFIDSRPTTQKIGDAGKSGIPDRVYYISNGSMERTGWPTSVR